MRRFKKSIVLGVVVLLLVGLGVYLATDEARQRAIVITAIEAWTGGTLEIEGDVSFSIGAISSFSAERITFALPSAGSSGTVGRIRVSIDTLSAVDGPLIIEELLVEQAHIRVDGLPDSDNAPERASDDEVGLPNLQRVEIINTRLDISLSTPDEYSTITIDELTVLQVGEGSELEIAGDGLFDDVALALTGGIGPFEETENAAVNAPLRLTFSSSGVRVTAVGTIFDVFRDAQLDVAVTAIGFSGGVLDRMAEPLALQDAQINFNGKLLGPIARPRVADLEATIEGDGFSLALTGEIGDPAHGAGVDVLFDGIFGGDYVQRLIADWPQSLGLGQIDASGRVTGALTRINLSGLDVTAHLAGQARLSASGQVILADALSELKVLDADLALQLNAPTAQLLGDLIDDKLNTIGPIEGEAHLAGSDGTVALERIDLLAGKGEKVRLRVTGRIPWVAGNLAESLDAAELSGTLIARDTGDLAALLGFELPSMGVISLNTSILPVGDDVDFTNVEIVIGDSDKFRIIAIGGAHLHGEEGTSFLDRIDVTAKLTSSTSSAFTQLFGFDLPELGPTAGTARITGDEDTVSVRSIDMQFGETKDLKVGVTGRIDRIDLFNGGKVIGLDLNVALAATSVTPIAQLTDLDLPELGRVTGTARITGDGDRLSAQSIDIRFGETEGLNVGVTGRIGRIDLISDGQYRDLDLNVTVAAPTVASIAQLADVDLPELGPVRATARLQDRDKGSKLAVEAFSVSVESESGLVLSITGTFDDVLNPQMGVMNAKVRANSVELSKAMNWPSIAGLETITADIELTARDGSLGIERLSMASEDSDAISVTARGVIDDLLNFDEVDLDIKLSAPDAVIFGPALRGFMRPRGALEIEGKVVVAKPNIRFDGGIRLGENDIDATLTGSIAGVRPSLTGQITAKWLELDAFGIDARSREADQPAQVARSNEQRDYIFDKEPLPFEALFAADLDLTVTADGGHGLGQSFDALQAQIRLQDGRLGLNPFMIAYADGNVEFSGMVDATVDPPTVELRLRGSDFELGELLLYIQAEPTAAGDLTGDFELESHGSSPRELAENLSGTADLALENGRVNGFNLHVLSNETFEYLLSLPNLSQSTEVRCAIARFDIEAGVAKSQALLIATPRMTLSGTGEVDFSKEELNFSFSADPKSFVPVIFKKPVRIHGEFSDLEYSTGSATIGLLGGVIEKVAGFVAAPFVFAPVSAAGSLVEILAETGEESPCLAAGTSSLR